jgi:hypothetical protein
VQSQQSDHAVSPVHEEALRRIGTLVPTDEQRGETPNMNSFTVRNVSKDTSNRNSIEK